MCGLGSLARELSEMVSYRQSCRVQLVARQEGAIVGRLEDFQFDLGTYQIFGYRVKGAGLFSRAGGLRASLLEKVGSDVAFVARADLVEWIGGARNNEMGRAWASQYRGMRVMSRTGASVGSVTDLLFDPDRGEVLGLLLDGDRMVELGQGVALGEAAVILSGPEKIQGIPTGLVEREGDWSRWIRERYRAYSHAEE